MGSNFGDKNPDINKKVESTKESSSLNLKIGESLTGSVKPEASGQSEGSQGISKLASAIMDRKKVTKDDLQDIVNQVSKETENGINSKRKHELINEASKAIQDKFAPDTKRQMIKSKDNYPDYFTNMTEEEQKKYYRRLLDHYKEKSRKEFLIFKEIKDIAIDQNTYIREIQGMIEARIENSLPGEKEITNNINQEYKQWMEHLSIGKDILKKEMRAINKNNTKMDINSLEEQMKNILSPKTNEDFVKLNSILDASSIIRISHFSRKAEAYDKYNEIQNEVINGLTLIQETLDPLPEEAANMLHTIANPD